MLNLVKNTLVTLSTTYPNHNDSVRMSLNLIFIIMNKFRCNKHAIYGRSQGSSINKIGFAKAFIIIIIIIADTIIIVDERANLLLLL